MCRSQNKRNVFYCVSGDIILAPNVYYSCVFDGTSNDSIFTFSSDKLDVDELQKWFLNNVQKSYVPSSSNLDFAEVVERQMELAGNMGGQLMTKKMYMITKQRLKHKKTFLNLFGKHIQEAKKRIDFFLNNKDAFYDRLGNPYTFGLLLYGPPGTGKTSFIKALSTYTKRNIISIDLRKIPKDKIHNIFSRGDINDNSYTPSANLVSIEDSIVVFEEVDFIYNFQKRSETVEIVAEQKTETKTESKDELADLQFMLNLLDGVVEHSGRIIIMTTNLPNKLDGALIRPGRIDFQIKFDYCDKEMVEEMYNNFYSNNISFSKKSFAEFNRTDLSAASLNKLMCKYFEEPDVAYSKIMSSENIDEEIR
jgi:ATP-dependent Zn protease